MKAMTKLMFSFLAAVTVTSPVSAQGGPDNYELAFLADVDPQEALLDIDEKLRTLEMSPALQPRLHFDLLRLKADCLVGLGRLLEAASVVSDLASIAEADPNLERDPVPLWQEASRLYESGRKPLEALEAARQIGSSAPSRSAPRMRTRKSPVIGWGGRITNCRR